MEHRKEESAPSLSLPAIVAWAQREAEHGKAIGKPLSPWQVADARDVGVRRVALVQLCLVDALPALGDSEHLQAVYSAGMLTKDACGLALGHVVFLLRARAGERRVLRHELRHVAQYEAAGSLKAFISTYLMQVAEFGYRNAPLEMDARMHETQSAAKRAESLAEDK